MTKTLRIASCQFPVCGDIAANGRLIRRLIRRAADGGAHLCHFCEGALSGYAGVDFPSFTGFDWDSLRRETDAIRAMAADAGTWVALGSSHFVSDRIRPTNCVYVIDDAGRIAHRYDKGMCTDGDLQHYTPGNRLVDFTLRGVKLGVLICYDGCHPEMYNAYRHRGVQVMLHSFHNAARDGWTVLDCLVPAQVPTRAADNNMWVVATNSARRHQAWASFVARPDASVAGRLRRHATGVLTHDFPDHDLKGWLHNYKMMKLHPDEVFHRGKPVHHPRIEDPHSQP